jgi:hypothetical protein
MAAINTGKVVVGGLVAGIVFLACDMAASFTVMASDMEALMNRLNLNSASVQTPASMASWVLCDLALGLVIIWTYAAIRPRFGPGPRTALVAGFVPYLTYTIAMYGFTVMGILLPDAFVKGAVVYLVITAIASVAGAFFYKEDKEE